MNIQQITFGNGCFWCTEAIFQSVVGVIKAEAGYMGGTLPNPGFMDISHGKTGHAEVVKLQYDADLLTFKELLLIFFKTHNPTLLQRAGGDLGGKYRSVIFYYDEDQRAKAEAMIVQLTDDKVFDKPIVTEVTAASEFYKADDHHQNYYNDNPAKPYCTFVIQPKLTKFAQEFAHKMKPDLLQKNMPLI